MKTVCKSASEVAALPRLAVALLLALPAAPGAASSLWSVARTGERGMFADRKAGLTGDILTIVVSENAAATNSQNKSTNRASSVEDSVGQFLFSPAVSKFGTRRGELPNTSLSGSGTNSGGGEVSNNQSLSSRAAVLVTDVLPNGNLVIEGVRVVTFSGETQYVVLHGIVRRDDISPANTILSSNIADARVEFVSQGQLTDAQKRGWITKLYEKLRPF